MTRPRRIQVGLLAACLGAGLAARAWAETSNRILAIVNEDIITEADITSQLNAMLEDEEVAKRLPDDRTAVREQLLEHLIEEKLILQEAKRLNLTVNPNEVEERLAEIRNKFDGPQAYAQMLQQAQWTEDQLKDKLRQQILAQKTVDQQVRSKIVVRPSEVPPVADAPAAAAPGAERVKVIHVLIRVKEDRTREQAEALAHQLDEKIRQGADIGELAKQYSEDGHAEDGGLLGWVHKGELLPELDQTIFTLKPGECSGPIATRLGFHLVKVLERGEDSPVELAKAQDQREYQVYQQKFNQALRAWLDKLKDHAYIQRSDHSS